MFDLTREMELANLVERAYQQLDHYNPQLLSRIEYKLSNARHKY